MYVREGFELKCNICVKCHVIGFYEIMCVELMYSGTPFIRTPKIWKTQSTKQHLRLKYSNITVKYYINAVICMQMINY